MYLHNTWIHLKPEHRDEYIALLVDEVRLAKQREPGIKRFDVYQNLDDPNLIHTYEVYVDKAAHIFHYEQPYLKAFYERTAAMYDMAKMGAERPVECRNLEPSDAAWK